MLPSEDSHPPDTATTVPKSSHWRAAILSHHVSSSWLMGYSWSVQRKRKRHCYTRKRKLRWRSATLELSNLLPIGNHYRFGAWHGSDNVALRLSELCNEIFWVVWRAPEAMGRCFPKVQLSQAPCLCLTDDLLKGDFSLRPSGGDSRFSVTRLVTINVRNRFQHFVKTYCKT